MRAESDTWIEFEWAVVRIVPRVHREQFDNVGVIVHAREAGFLEARIEPNWQRILDMAPELDRAVAERHLDGYLRICRGDEGAGAVALLPPSERFHWLTAPRSDIIQASPVHPGRRRRMEGAVDELFDEQCG